MASNVFNEILRKSFYESKANLKKEQIHFTKSDLTHRRTLTIDRKGNRIDKLDDNETKEISDGVLTKNEDGTIHCKSEYLGEFDYDPELFAYGYKNIPESRGTSQLPVLKYIGKNRTSGVIVPEGLEIGDYMFEGNKDLVEPPQLPESLWSKHCMFANCNNLTVDGKIKTNLEKEQAENTKSDLSGFETVITKSNGDRIDSIDNMPISDGVLWQNNDGTVHCYSRYLGEFDYDPKEFAYGYKEVQEEDGTISQLPVLKYIGKGRDATVVVPEGLEIGDYMFEGNENLFHRPHLSKSVKSSHCMFANCKNLKADGTPVDSKMHLRMEQTAGTKLNLISVETLTTDSNGNRIDKFDDNELKEISDGVLIKNEDGTIHCKSDYLGEFDYDPELFAYGYKEIPEVDGTTSQLPVLKYIGKNRTSGVIVPEGLESGDYTFEGNEDLIEKPNLPESLKSSHCMFANCKNLMVDKNLKKEQTLGEKSDLTGIETVTIDSDGDRIDKLYYNEIKEISDSLLTKNKDGTIHCKSAYLGEFDYDPKEFAYGYKEVQGEDGTTSQLPILKYIGDKSSGDDVKIPEGLKSGDYMFEGNETLKYQPELPETLKSAHYMFADCKTLKFSDDSTIPMGLEDASGMYKGATKFQGANRYRPNGIIYAEGMLDGTAIDEKLKQDALYKTNSYEYENPYMNKQDDMRCLYTASADDTKACWEKNLEKEENVDSKSDLSNEDTVTTENNECIKEQTVGAKSDLTSVETLTTDSNGNRIDKFDDNQTREISDGLLTKNEDGTIHCKSDYLGEFDYDPKEFAYGYKEVQGEDGTTSQLPILKYIGKEYSGDDVKIPYGLESGDYMFEGNETLIWLPSLPYTLKSAHYMFANCKELEHGSHRDTEIEIPRGLEDASGMYRGSSQFQGDYVDELNEIANTEGMFDGTATGEKHKRMKIADCLKKEQTIGEKSELTGIATVTTDSDGDRIDKLYYNETKEISDGSLTKNEDGTIHCKSDYLGEFDYDPKEFAYGYKEIQVEDGLTAQLPILKYIGEKYNGTHFEIPEGLKSGDYMFEGNETLMCQPHLPESVTSSHCMFANCKNLKADGTPVDTKIHLRMEQTVGAKSDLTSVETLTTDSNGNRIDKLDDNELKEISDGVLIKNEDGTVHCISDYLGTFTYSPKEFAYGYKEVQGEDGTTSQLPILKYIGKDDGYSLEIPYGLKSGDYMFEGNETLKCQSRLPYTLKSAHYMFANCENLTDAYDSKVDSIIPMGLEDASCMYKGSSKFESFVYAPNEIANTEGMLDGTAIDEKLTQDALERLNSYYNEFMNSYEDDYVSVPTNKDSETQSTQDMSLNNSEKYEEEKSVSFTDTESNSKELFNETDLSDVDISKEETAGEKSDLTGIKTLTIDSNGDRIDKLDDTKFKRISDGVLTKNEDGTVHCYSRYLGEFDYDPKDFAYGYKEIQAEDGTTSQLPILKYIGKDDGYSLKVPVGLKSGDYMFEGNETLEYQPELPETLKSAHYMFADCKNLTYGSQGYALMPMGLEDASGMYRGSSQFQGAKRYRPNGIIYAEGMLDGTAIDEKLKQDAFKMTNSYDYENPYVNKQDKTQSTQAKELGTDRTKGISNKIQEILYSVKNKKIIDIAKNLKMEETVGEKSDLTGIATVTTDSNGNSIDKLGNNEVKEISDGSLTKNEDGTVHCESDYLGTFDYDPTVFTYGYKEIQEDNGKTSQLPILKYIGQFRSGYSFNIPEGLESGDYSFEGNENLVEQPSLPKSLKSAHYMFANCKNLAYAKIGNWKSSLKEFSDKLDVPSMFTDASGMYKGATKIKSDIFAKLSNNINVQDMFGSTTTNENYKQADNNKNHASAYGFNKQGSQSNLEKESETQSTQDTSLDNSMNTAQNTSQSSSKSKFSERIYGESTSMDTSRNTSQSNSKSKFSGRIYGDGTSSNRSLPSVAEYCDDSGYGVEL